MAESLRSRIPDPFAAGGHRTPPPRVVVADVMPVVDGGRHPAKAVMGDEVVVSADVFADGHDRVAAALVVHHPGGGTPRRIAMAELDNDRWHGRFRPDSLGMWHFAVAGWVDAWSTWCHGAEAKRDAGVLTDVDLQIGRALLDDVGRSDNAAGQRCRDASLALAGGDLGSVLADELVHEAMWWGSRTGAESGLDTLYPVDVDRERAAHSSWYELFPRSWGPGERHGTFADVAERLDYVADMGFDVLYLPPVHPIGRTKRKGRDNTTEAEPADVGSPWAIGGPEGGHTALHPELGTLGELRSLRLRAEARGVELALDLAFQCSPDHPWVTDHPQWFRHRPDGTIQYAENPPKKYEDIYPIDFETDDWEALWQALAGVVQHWIDVGIRIFRVDNPHTKPLPFWEWLIAEIRRDHPDVLFLSEAFTRPAMMYHLAKVGFDQSYTYFTWRTTSWELADYCRELTTPPVSWFFRPNFWPNTPDILVPPLQHGDRAAFASRAVLAATLAANWGVYGPAFELMENEPRPGADEYRRNEKYEIRDWHVDRPGTLRPLLGRLNRIRREHPAFHRDTTLHIHHCDNPGLLVYSRTAGPDRILCVVATDTRHDQRGNLDLDLAALGLHDDEDYDVTDLLGGGTWRWRGRHRAVEVQPGVLPGHVYAVTRPGADRNGGVS